MSDTPIYEQLMDEFFPVTLELELEPGWFRALSAHAWIGARPLEMILQDALSDKIHKGSWIG